MHDIGSQLEQVADFVSNLISFRVILFGDKRCLFRRFERFNPLRKRLTLWKLPGGT